MSTVVDDPGLGRSVQIAYAADDVLDAAARFSAATGAGPFFVVEHIPLASVLIDGAPGEFDHSSAYGQWGALMVEIVAEHTAPLMPRTGVHHVAFMVASLPAAIAAAVARGWPERLAARTAGGVEFAFVDARRDLGHLVELYEPSDALLDLYRFVAGAAAGWDGDEPVRPLR